jgi:PKD repeat protein
MKSLLIQYAFICIAFSTLAQTPPTAAFTASSTNICPGETVTFTDLSTDSIFGWIWYFPGGNPDTDYIQNPTVTYTTPGTYNVSLTVVNLYGMDSLTQTGYITVHPLPNANAGTDQTICTGDTAIIQAAGQTGGNFTLQTTFAAGNGQRGNMFDVTAIHTLVISSFDCHLAATTDMAIYYKVGTHLGFEANSAAWTLVGTAANVVAQPVGLPTVVPITVDVTIPAGQTYAWYITSTLTTVSLKYTDGTAVGNIYIQDANLQIKEGKGIDYPFGSTYAPRIWNGIIHYALGDAYTYLWSTGSTVNPLKVSPLANTTYTLTVTDAYGCTGVDTVDVIVNVAPTVPTITWNGSQLSTQTGYTAYQWYLGGVLISGATGASWSPVAYGFYTVRITAANGCKKTSAQFWYNTTGTEPTQGMQTFTISPNPVHDGGIMLSLPFDAGEYNVQLISSMGKLVLNDVKMLETGNSTLHYPVTGLSPGIYLIQVKGKNIFRQQKLVIE